MKSGYNIVRRGKSKIRNAVKNLWAAIKSETLDSAFSLSEEQFIACFDVESISNRLDRHNLTTGKDAILKYYGNRINENWPSLPNSA